jgi:hypothetical protein
MAHYVPMALKEFSYIFSIKICHFGKNAYFYSHRSDFLEAEYLNYINATFLVIDENGQPWY